MSEIEFLDPGPAQGPGEPWDAPEPAAQPPVPDPVGYLLAWLPGSLWAAATALTVIAPFRDLYTIRGGSGVQQTVDGWGRVGGVSSGFHQHGPRYGVLVVVAAVLFAGCAVLAVLAAARGGDAPDPVPTRVRTGLAIAGTALLVGTAGSVFLTYLSTRDILRSEAASVSGGSTGAGTPGFSLHADVGGFVWLTLAAFGCAVFAILCSAVAGLRGPRLPEYTQFPGYGGPPEPPGYPESAEYPQPPGYPGHAAYPADPSHPPIG